MRRVSHPLQPLCPTWLSSVPLTRSASRHVVPLIVGAFPGRTTACTTQRCHGESPSNWRNMSYSTPFVWRCITPVSKSELERQLFPHTFELQCCQDEDVQVTGWCHDQDDVCQLAQLPFFLIFCFLASSALFSLAFHFSDVVER